jgi:hypothetical protein
MSTSIKAAANMPAAELSFAQAEQVIQAYFDHSPQDIADTMNRAVECFNWLGALFQCIEEANNGGSRAHSAALIQSLSSLGAYVASDYQVSIIGVDADTIQASIRAAEEDKQRGLPFIGGAS